MQLEAVYHIDQRICRSSRHLCGESYGLQKRIKQEESEKQQRKTKLKWMGKDNSLKQTKRGLLWFNIQYCCRRHHLPIHIIDLMGNPLMAIVVAVVHVLKLQEGI